MKSLQYLLLLCTICLSINRAGAQYKGGSYDGFDAIGIIQLTNTNVAYMGGLGDGFAIASTDLSLPVTFGSFTAAYTAQTNTTKLDWQTFTEINTDFFTAERSTDNTAWSFVARVIATGNSTVQKSYAALDKYPVAGKNFYRIISTDKDGRTTTSPVKMITVSATGGSAVVFNNPVTDVLNVQVNLLSQGSYSFNILQADGKQIAGKQLTLGSGISNLSFDLRSKPAGIYYVVIKQQDGTALQTIRVLKQ